MASSPGELEAWLAVLEHDHSDIRVALDWADRALDVDVLLRLAAGLGPSGGRTATSARVGAGSTARSSLSAGQRTDLRADLLNAAGYLSRARGDSTPPDAQYREALAIREELGDRSRIAASLRFVGNVAFDRGDLDGAEDWWRRSLEPSRRRRREPQGQRLNNLGVVAHHRGDYQKAHPAATTSPAAGRAARLAATCGRGRR